MILAYTNEILCNTDESQRAIVRSAFRHWEENTCVRFLEVPTNYPVGYSHLMITRENTGYIISGQTWVPKIKTKQGN